MTVQISEKELIYAMIDILHASSDASTYNASLGAGRTVPLLFSNVRCTGSETMLTSCPYDSNLGDCTLIHPAAGVTCHMCKFPF